MTVKYHRDLVQGSDEWLAARCGLLTSSEMNLILTPTLKVASNEKERVHMYELLAQRITRHVEPQYISSAMLRGEEDEIEARLLYAKHYTKVEEVGFVTNDKWGFTLGYSPDGLVGDNGAIECKSRCQKYQAQTVLENLGTDDLKSIIPSEFVLQLQCGMLVAELEFIDFVSYCGGMPLIVIRVLPDMHVQAAIIDAALQFEHRLQKNIEIYESRTAGLIKTERRLIEEITL